MESSEINNTPSFRYRDKILPLIKVLDDLYNITFFHFGRIHYKYGKITLGNSLHFAPRYWEKYAKIDPAFHADRVKGREWMVYGLNPLSKEEEEMFAERTQLYNLPEGIVLIKETSEYRDIYNFASYKYQNDRLNPLIKNIPALRLYCDFFLKEVAEIINEPQNYTPIIESSTFFSLELFDINEAGSLKKGSNSYTDKFVKETLSQFADIRLTEIEAKCLYWAIREKTAEETAEILGNSRRTVEGHLSSIREKFGCSKISGVLIRAEKLGFISGGEIYLTSKYQNIK